MCTSPDRVLNVNNTPVNDFAKHVAFKSPTGEDGEWIEMDTSDGDYDIVYDLGSKLVIYDDSDSDSDLDMYSVSTIFSSGSAATDRMDIDTPSSTSDSDSDSDEFEPFTILVKINTLPHAALDWEVFNLARYSLQARIQAGRFENPALNIDNDDGSRMLRIETRETHENREIIYGSVELWLGFLMEAITDGFFVGIPFRMVFAGYIVLSGRECSEALIHV
ncbi:hypothetical protein ASPWEDRAFT_475978 [Aspergillus wentii DTO 134E9]|uniref:Uncharacterized protein n=1 Tax=Aspergillus wentii DTO 134E9 TaxID=1073089 RepID=A0A1L9RIT9_ASPWE|nr:uncharacterized protein ASPWEDRAFT_475978 [Aspergillus wentii DTO 134E9]OJJ34767.1 hypothetical protein ASPWEDRAFT_475978 [Aspergillus wentii DTO 134E9]